MKHSQQIEPKTNRGIAFKKALTEYQYSTAGFAEASQQAHGLEALIDEHEYCRITGRSLASARRDRLLGKGCAYVKLLGLVRYRPSDVRAFIEANLRGGNTGRLNNHA
jgi:hypothetical protein